GTVNGRKLGQEGLAGRCPPGEIRGGNVGKPVVKFMTPHRSGEQRVFLHPVLPFAVEEIVKASRLIRRANGGGQAGKAETEERQKRLERIHGVSLGEFG